MKDMEFNPLAHNFYEADCAALVDSLFVKTRKAYRRANVDAMMRNLHAKNVAHSSPKAPPPDPLIGQSAIESSKLAREHLDWVKSIYADTAEDRKKASDVAIRESEAQIALADTQRAQSQQANQRYNEVFKPLEDRQVAGALDYNTAERRDQAAADAVEGVGAQFGTARQTLQRTVGANGGNPNSGNFLATMANLGVREAATRAAAGNQARKQVEVIGDAKLADAVALGRGVVTQGAQQAQMSLNSGNSGVGNSQVPLNVAGQGVSMVGTGYQGAQQGHQGAGNLMLGQYRTQVDAARLNNNDAMWGAVGNVAGAIISDKNKKTDRKPVKDGDATKAVRKMPVKQWKYKKGVSDEGRHIGPMAQSVQKAAGDRVAPGGKMIDLVSMNGITLAAIRDVDKRLQRLEKRPTLSLKKGKK